MAIAMPGRSDLTAPIRSPCGSAGPTTSRFPISSAALPRRPILFDAFTRISAKRSPLPPAPKGVVFARTSDLPAALQRFRPDSLPEIAASGPGDPPLAISFPPEGARIDMTAEENDVGLALKAMGGAPPFTWFADGKPIVTGELRRETAWEKPGKGFARLSVIDAHGHSASVQVRLD